MKTIIKEKIYIKTTNDDRTIRILLPDNYHTSNTLYPVLYMHDGQNLFEDETSYGGHSWGVYEALVKMGYDMIVVGIDNSNLRMFEYSPWKNSNEVYNFGQIDVGGLGEVYGNFVVHDVIPFIEKKYRAIKDFNHRFIAGSSLGAYISCYMIAKFPNLFSVAGIFSLASWFNEKSLLDYIKGSSIGLKHSFFISIGKHESSQEKIKEFNDIYLNNSRNLRHLLEKKEVSVLKYIETDDIHHELAWRKVFPDFIKFIKEKPTR